MVCSRLPSSWRRNRHVAISRNQSIDWVKISLLPPFCSSSVLLEISAWHWFISLHRRSRKILRKICCVRKIWPLARTLHANRNLVKMLLDLFHIPDKNCFHFGEHYRKQICLFSSIVIGLKYQTYMQPLKPESVCAVWICVTASVLIQHYTWEKYALNSATNSNYGPFNTESFLFSTLCTRLSTFTHFRSVIKTDLHHEFVYNHRHSIDIIDSTLLEL